MRILSWKLFEFSVCCCQVGDYRVQFSYAGRHGEEFTVVGRQSGREIRAYQTQVKIFLSFTNIFTTTPRSGGGGAAAAAVGAARGGGGVQQRA